MKERQLSMWQPVMAAPVTAAPASGPRDVEDQDTREKIIDGVDRSCVIEASAGTGKTSLLVNRIVNLVGSGAKLDEVVAITFTEKAAGELRTRVRDAIQSNCRDENNKDRDRFAAALADMDRSTISTIHSFCTQLLRVRPVEAGISPGFSVADDVESGLILDEAWEKWKQQEFSNLDSPLRQVLEAGAKLGELRFLAGVLVENRDLLEKAGSSPLLSGPLPEWRDAFNAFCESLRPELLDEIETLPAQCVNRSDAACLAVERHLPALRRAAVRIRGGSSRAPLRALSLSKFPIGGRTGNRVNWGDRHALARLRELAAELNEAREQFGNLFRCRAAIQATRSLIGLLDIYDSIKSERGRIDFQDILIRTRNLVRDHPEVRRDLSADIGYLLVDEFQDTDPLQAEIVFLLAGELSGDGPRSWDEVRIAPGRLVIVGDPKQSIYRFRRADIQMYERARNALRRSGGDLHQIRVNFRTRKGIADWVNKVFDRLMPSGNADGFRPAYSPLVAFREVDEERGGPAVVRLPLPPPVDGQEARRNLEASKVAALIGRRVAAGAWTVFPKSGEPRPAGYGDVAVLFRTLTGLENYEDAFREAGVPYRIDGGKYYFQRGEVQSLLAVLRAIDSPNNRDSVVAALRSSFYGFDDETLLIAAAEGRFDYRLRERPSNPELAAAFDQLHSWHERRHLEDIPAIVEDVLDRTRALEFFALQPLGHQQIANLMKVVDEARRYSAKGGTYRAFIAHLSDREEAEKTESESPVFEEDEGGYVQFLTIHAAKGLEFPVVIVADLLTAIPSRSRRICLDRERGRLAFRLEGLRGGTASTPEWDELVAGDDAQQEAEEIRLFYVAATRARDLLILPLAEKETNGKCFHKLLKRADWPPDLDVSDLVSESGAAGTAASPGGVSGPRRRPIAPGDLVESAASREVDQIRHDFAERRTALLESLPFADRVIGPSRLKPEGAAMGAGRVSGAASECMPDNIAGGAAVPGAAATDRGKSGAAPAHDSVRALALGSLVHAVLQRVDLDRHDAGRWIDRLLPQHPPLSSADRADAARLAGAALDSPVWERARRSRRCLRETPFLLKHDEGVYVDGAVDLLIDEDEGLVVVDFKTDRVGSDGVEPLFARYRGQALGYALGVSGSSGRPVQEVTFVFLDVGETRSVKVDAALLEEAGALVSAAAREPR